MRKNLASVMEGEIVRLEPLARCHEERLFEAKLLMLEHAFERLGCLRVEFKTDSRNDRSRAALAALPARFEGVLCKHMLVRGGERRDSAYYSIIDYEWPEARKNLGRRIDAIRKEQTR
jgi:hypothetical protein